MQQGGHQMRRSDQAIDHLFGLCLVLFVLPVIICSVFIYLPWLFLRPLSKAVIGRTMLPSASTTHREKSKI